MKRILYHRKACSWTFRISQRKPLLRESSTTSPQPIYYISKICDAWCTATFSEKYVKIYYKEDQCLWTGMRNLQDFLWDIQVNLLPAVSPVIQHANGIVNKKITKTDHVRYQHLPLVNPTSNALLKGIKKFLLTTFPGLDEKYLVRI